MAAVALIGHIGYNNVDDGNDEDNDTCHNDIAHANDDDDENDVGDNTSTNTNSTGAVR